MKYILEGSEQEVNKVLRENSIRVARGLVKFSPVPSEEEAPKEEAPAEAEAADATEEAPKEEAKNTKKGKK